MTLRDIQTLVTKGESLTLEFKRKVAHPEKIVREIVAFANTEGGLLLIGVDDDGSIPGLKYAEEEAFALETAVRKLCKPPIPLHFEIVPLSEKRAILKYQIESSTRKPHVVKDTDRLVSYVRFKDRSIQASKEMREILRRQRKPKNMRFVFGEKEKILMEYLEERGEITLQEFATVARIKKYVASKTLILLVLANLLEIEPREGKDIYRLNGVA